MTLRGLRERAGLDCYQVARKMNVAYTAVWYWENGKNGILRKHQKKLARLYGCTESELRAGLEETKAQSKT